MNAGPHAAKTLAIATSLLLLASASSASAQSPPGEPADAPADAETPPPPKPHPSDPPVLPADSPARAGTAEPTPATPKKTSTPFRADPVTDGAIIAAAGGFGGLLEAINSTGEIRPQQIAPNFDRSSLLWIDRVAVYQDGDKSARLTSNIGIFAALGFAIADPIMSGFREHSVQASLVDGIIYAESIAITFGLTNLAKIAIRRPRPEAYIEAEKHRDDPNYSNSKTDSSLSFFSGHASMSASISATATYLAFVRAPHTARPWVTLFTGIAVTSFISFERVRAGAHFPTDVIAGAIAGAGVGMIVPHFHRTGPLEARRVWVGFAPAEGNGGAVQLGGVF